MKHYKENVLASKKKKSCEAGCGQMCMGGIFPILDIRGKYVFILV